MTLLAAFGFSSSQVARCSLTVVSTAPRTSELPSLVFVWPSNCGSMTRTERTQVSPSRTSSPESDSSAFLRRLFFFA